MADQRGTQLLMSQGGLTFLGKLLGRVLGFLYLTTVTRLVEPDVYGLFSLGLAVVMFIQGLADLNLNRAVSYFVPTYLEDDDPGRAQSVLRTSLVFAVISSVVVGGIVVLVREPLAATFDTPGLVVVLPALALVLPLRTLNRVLVAVFDASKRLQYRVLSLNLIQPVVKFVGSVGLLLLGFEITGLVAGHLVALALSGVASAYFVLSRLSWPTTTSSMSASLGNLLTYSLPLAFAGVFYAVTSQIDFFVIGYFGGSDDVGVYRVGYLLVGNLLIFGRSMQPILKPMIVEARDDHAMLQSRFQTATRWVLLLMLPAGITLLVASQTYLTLLFTADYAGGATAMSFLVVGYVVNSHLGSGGIVLEGLGYTRLRFGNAVLLVLINVLLDILLVPRYGIAGAGLATAVALTAAALAANAEVYYLRGVLPYSWAMSYVFGGGAAALTVAFVTAQALGSGLALAVVLPPVVLAAYLLVFHALGGVTDADREVARLLDERIGRRVFQRLVS